VTAVCADIRRTSDFYVRVLGLRLVKQTVSYDDPSTRHFFFGDRFGSPGTVITFLEWRHIGAGQVGAGTAHHIAFTVAGEAAQRRWISRLRRLGVSTSGPRNRTYFRSVYFLDPDGLTLELATRGPGFAVDEPADRLGERVIPPPSDFVDPLRRAAADPEPPDDDVAPTGDLAPDMALQGLHHVTLFGRDMDRTMAFYRDGLGLRIVKRTFSYEDPEVKHVYFGDARGDVGTIVAVHEVPRMRLGRAGPGVVHHIALAVPGAAELDLLRARLQQTGSRSTAPADRRYFRSIYVRGPDGELVEVATRGPGFLVDEPEATLGTRFLGPDRNAREGVR
jgi:glyoxalase family protein